MSVLRLRWFASHVLVEKFCTLVSTADIHPSILRNLALVSWIGMICYCYIMSWCCRLKGSYFCHRCYSALLALRGHCAHIICPHAMLSLAGWADVVEHRGSMFICWGLHEGKNALDVISLDRVYNSCGVLI